VETGSDTGGSDRGPERRGCLAVLIGVGLVLVGVPMLVCPGPGMAAIASGIGMIAVGLGLRRPDAR
jgi:hypothetical protein